MTEPELVEGVQAPLGCAADTSRVNSNKSSCTLCSKKFNSIQEAMKHELLTHSKKNLLNPSRTSLHTKLRTVLKSVNDEEVETFRHQLCNALHQCEPDCELATIIKLRRMNSENLELIYMRITQCLQNELHKLNGVNIYPFGSIVSGLALRDCDIDLYIEMCPQLPTNIFWPQSTVEDFLNCQHLYNKIHRLLRASKNFEQVYAIKQARVPIIKCKHINTGFNLDINVSCPSSVHNTNFLRDLMLLDTRIHELFLFLKIWAKELKLISAGNMTSYCLIGLIIFYLQQPHITANMQRPSILPSIKKLQSTREPLIVLGVNYAYDLQTHVSPLPSQLTVMQLINEFFTYYSDFDFEKYVVSPYLGTTLPVDAFRNGEYIFEEYEYQLHAITVLYDTPAQTFPLNRCVHVQDPFSLNHNVAASMTSSSLEYFRKCMQCAQRICGDMYTVSASKIYERLLFSIIEDMTSISKIEQSKLPKELICRFTPTRAELRTLTAHTKISDSKELHKLWVEHYIEAFKEILTEVYLLDLQSATPSHQPKHERRDNADRSDVWLISGNIDTWSGRLHVRNANENFITNQLAQTSVMQQNHHQQSTNSVNLSGVFTVNIICNYTAIEVILTRQNSDIELGINKNHPLRKFFNIFKCTMQSWKLGEKLQEI